MAVRSVLVGTNQALDNNTATGGAASVWTYGGTEVAGDRIMVYGSASTGTGTALLDNLTGYNTPTGPDRSAGAVLTTYGFDKVLNGTDLSASPDILWSAGFRGANIAFVMSGLDSTAAIVGTPLISTTGTSLTTPTLTTTVNNSEVFVVVAAQNTGTGAAPTISLPGTYTSINSIGTAHATGVNIRLTAGRLTTPGNAGSYGGDTVTVGGTPAHSIVYTLAYAPAPGAGGTMTFIKTVTVG